MVLKSQKALKIVLKLLIVFDIKQKVRINRWTADNRKYEPLVNFGFMNPEVKKINGFVESCWEYISITHSEKLSLTLT